MPINFQSPMNRSRKKKKIGTSMISSGPKREDDKQKKALYRRFYQKLFKHFGPQHWWPAETSFEVIVGAILTQNTNWGNVEKALSNLKKHKRLSPEKLRTIPTTELAQLIRPAGYFNVKAKRLKNFLTYFIKEYQGSVAKMKKVPLDDLRRQLLKVNGIGPETADSILLYALNKKVFVVDAYTKRFLVRHNIVLPQATYHDIQDQFVQAIKSDLFLYNEYHALIVMLGKYFCKPTPKCEKCPLRDVSYDMIKRCPTCFRTLLPHEKKMCRQC